MAANGVLRGARSCLKGIGVAPNFFAIGFGVAPSHFTLGQFFRLGVMLEKRLF